MILDGFLSFDGYPTSSFSFNQAAATYTSANILDLHMTTGIPSLANGQGARDMGIGDDPALKLLVQVLTTCTSGGAATLQVALQGAQDNGSGSPGAYSTYWTSPTYALGTLVQGARLYDMDLPRPPAGIGMPRFLRMQYIIGAAAGTGGTLASLVVIDRPDQPYQSAGVLGGYPAGITVAN